MLCHETPQSKSCTKYVQFFFFHLEGDVFIYSMNFIYLITLRVIGKRLNKVLYMEELPQDPNPFLVCIVYLPEKATLSHTWSFQL